MPIRSDPAPCAEGKDLYECRDCLTRLCSNERITSCPDCGGEMENLSKPRLQ
ncbi:MAG: rubrerythrin-like domain-containing protein [Halovenus sp.]|mgnify:CR=1 FL=1